jgi:predicted anti-sigma-YlaC factor YlaD
VPRRRPRTITGRIIRRLGLRTALARWGFTVCAAVALLNGLLWPALFAGLVAAYAWKVR